MSELKIEEQWLSFKLGGETYAQAVSYIKEIFSYEQPNPIPGAPENVEGMLDVRGKPLTVMSGRRLFSIEDELNKNNWRIIALETPWGLFGVSVEAVDEIVTIEPDSIESATSTDNEIILGTARTKNQLLILVDFLKHIERVAALE